MATIPREKSSGGASTAPRDGTREAVRGVVAAVAAMDANGGVRSPREARHPDIVDRVFGPGASPGTSPGAASATGTASETGMTASSAFEIPPIPGIQPQYPDLDVNFSIEQVVRKRASVLGAASKVAGDLVADESVEIQGYVEGCVRARRSRVTVGREGLVQSRIEARTVRVRGTIRGNVSAEDWVEVKSGGVIRGDVRAPRIILHDGAIVTGRLDMTSAVAARQASGRFDPLVVPPRPRMRKVPRERA